MIILDYRDKRPLYEQVTEKLEHLIICGALEANAKLPSVRALAMDLSVNPNTIQRAYAQLEQDGYIYTVVGRGNYVSGKETWQTGKLAALSGELTDALTRARDAGLSVEAVQELVRKVYTTVPETPGKDAPTPTDPQEWIPNQKGGNPS